MKLTYTTEPFQCMGHMEKLKQQTTALDTKIDEILQYFFFKGMNETFRNQLVLVTKNMHPTLGDIEEKFFQ